jgi:hypothetical protein
MRFGARSSRASRSFGSSATHVAVRKDLENGVCGGDCQRLPRAAVAVSLILQPSPYEPTSLGALSPALIRDMPMNDPDETIDGDDFGAIDSDEFDTIDSDTFETIDPAAFDTIDPDDTIDPVDGVAPVPPGSVDSTPSSESSDPFETWEEDS